MSGSDARLLLLGASHKTASLAVRERLAVPAEKLPEFHHGLHRLSDVTESLVLSTCNRLETYCVVGPGTTEAAIEDYICRFQGLSLREFHAHRQVMFNRSVIEHLIGVAAGVDSQMVGETEIFGQVKDAYATALQLGLQGPILDHAFQKAFQAAKHIRRSAPIGQGQISLASVAIDLATKIFGDLTNCRVLVIGTGEIGEKAARAFAGRGVRELTVVSRSDSRAQELSATIGARPGHFSQIEAALRTHDVVIGCTRATEAVVTTATLREIARKRKLHPLFLIDLGVPRNFEPESARLDSVFVYDLDDLVRIADDNLAARRAAIGRCRDIARDKSAAIWDRIEPRLALAGGKRDTGPLTALEQTS